MLVIDKDSPYYKYYQFLDSNNIEIKNVISISLDTGIIRCKIDSNSLPNETTCRKIYEVAFQLDWVRIRNTKTQAVMNFHTENKSSLKQQLEVPYVNHKGKFVKAEIVDFKEVTGFIITPEGYNYL